MTDKEALTEIYGKDMWNIESELKLIQEEMKTDGYPRWIDTFGARRFKFRRLQIARWISEAQETKRPRYRKGRSKTHLEYST